MCHLDQPPPDGKDSISETPGVTVGQGLQPGRLFPSLQTSSCPRLGPSCLPRHCSQHTLQGSEHLVGKVAWEQSSPGNGRSSLVIKAWAACCTGLCPAPSQMPLFLNEEIKPQIKKKKKKIGHRHQSLKSGEFLVHCLYEELDVKVCRTIKVSLMVAK